MSAANKIDADLFTGVVYGPIASRRLGRSLGINLLGEAEKTCSFDCAYCHLGPTESRLNKLKTDAGLPSVEELTKAIHATFTEIHAHGPVIDTICLSGNGEPTLHPEFPELVKIILAARDLWLPGKPVVIFTNGALVDNRKIAEALNKLDERIVKIDVGNEKQFKLLNAPISRTNLARVIQATRNLKDFVVQSLFVQGDFDNTAASDIDDWIEVIAILKPKGVQIHGLSREGAKPGLIRCDEDTLHSIASRLERRTAIKALITP